MKKKLLTMVLTVGMLLSLVGCGAKENTSSESVAETVVEVTEETTEYGTEETTEVAEEATTEVVEETVAEEPAKEKIPVDLTDGAAFLSQVLANFESQKYMVITRTETTNDINDINNPTIVEHELLFDFNNNISACIAVKEDGPNISYYDNNAGIDICRQGGP